METGILLESGTNELEILEFRVGKNLYGINVAKVREILSYQDPTPVPNADARIEGIFMPRDEIISVIDLAKCLGMVRDEQTTDTDMYIVTNFNKLNAAFHVSAVQEFTEYPGKISLSGLYCEILQVRNGDGYCPY